jgi:hypothetical protein
MVRLRPSYLRSATLARMDEERIVAAAEQAERHGGPVAAVLPMRTTAGAVRFACALARDDALAWVVLDECGDALDVPAEIRSVAETIAICETAEESGAMLAAAEADDLLLRSLQLVGDDETVAVALRAMREAIAPLLQTEEGVRVAEPGYLDRVAVTAAMVGDRFDYLKEIAYGVSAKLSGAPGETGEDLAESLWSAVRILARDGAPDRFREAVEGGMAAAQAFGEDVLANYVIDLEGR